MSNPKIPPQLWTVADQLGPISELKQVNNRDLLKKEGDQLGPISEADKAKIRSLNADTKVRIIMALVIAGLLIFLNAAVIFLVWKAFSADTSLLRDRFIQSNQRLITEDVFKTLIQATIVQVGVTLAVITRYLFPKKKELSDPAPRPT